MLKFWYSEKATEFWQNISIFLADRSQLYYKLPAYNYFWDLGKIVLLFSKFCALLTISLPVWGSIVFFGLFGQGHKLGLNSKATLRRNKPLNHLSGLIFCKLREKNLDGFITQNKDFFALKYGTLHHSVLEWIWTKVSLGLVRQRLS